MNHVVFTRMKFDDDALFKKYFEVMKRTYIPSLSKQTNKNFKVNIALNEPHKDLVFSEFEKNNIPYILSCPPEVAKKINVNIQTRHDCDDYMAPNYIQKIQDAYSENIQKYDDFIMHAMPTKYWINVDREYKIYAGYHERRISVFVTVCQKIYDGTKKIYDQPHTAMWKLSPNIINLGEGLVKLVIHGSNKYSVVKVEDLLLTDSNGVPIKNNL